MSDIMRAIRPLYVDHIAVTTPHFEETIRDYLALPHARFSRGPGHNESQNVRYAFVELERGIRVEVLGLPLSGDSPIAPHVERGGGAYHLCYAVEDIEASIKAAQAIGAHLVVPPKADPAFDGRPVAFLIHPAHGLLELVAAYPAIDAREPVALPATGSTASLSVPASDGTNHDKLMQVFRAVLKAVPVAEIPKAHIQTTKGWDSLAHIHLIMETERRFKIRLPMQDMAKLDSFAAFLNMIDIQSA